MSPQKRLMRYESLVRFELGQPGDAGFMPALYPIYVRGEAYRAAQRGSEAEAEFQKIIDYRGIVINEPIASLAHLGLARAYVMQGNTARARTLISPSSGSGVKPTLKFQSFNKPKVSTQHCIS